MSEKIKSILPFYLTAAAITSFAILLSAIFSISRLNKQILATVERNGEALVEMATGAAQNGLMASQVIDELVAERLISIAGLVDRLPQIDRRMLLEIVALNGLWAIDVLDDQGNLLVSSRQVSRPIFSKNKITSLIHGDETATAFTLKVNHREIFVLVQKREKSSGFIAIYIETARFSSFKRDIGIGRLIQRLAMNPEIVYLAFQDFDGILAATHNVRELSSIKADSFLLNAIKDSFPCKRITEFEGQKVLEVVKPIYLDGEFAGIFRLGMSLESVSTAASAGKRQIIGISAILLVLTIALIGAAFFLRQYSIARKAYKSLEASTEELLNRLPLGTLITNEDLEIRAANRKLTELFGITTHLVGKTYTEVFHNDELGILESKKSGEPVRRERMQHKFPDGRDGFITSRAMPIYGDSGRISGFVGLVEDVTQEVETERKIRRIRDLELIAELVATLAHDIKNPLNSISLMAQRIMRKGDPETADVARKIRDEIARIDQKFKEFLDIAAPLRLRKRNVRIDVLLREIAEAFKPECKSKSIKIELDLKPVDAQIDYEKFRRVVENLVKNAIEAMPNGGTLRLRCDTEGDHALIEVEDTGIGIPKDSIEKIFKPFYTTKPSGTGLGLAQVERTVAAHNGKVEVKSEPGKGTAFRIVLPLKN